MPDFKAAIREAISELNLPPEREVEIVEELSQDLEERFEKALSEGEAFDGTPVSILSQRRRVRTLDPSSKSYVTGINMLVRNNHNFRISST